MLRGLGHLTCEETLRELACSVWRWVGFQEDVQVTLPCLQGDYQEDRLAVHSGAWQEDE